MGTKRTSYNIDELRGLACFLLVAYHVVGVPGSGMQVGDDSWYRYATSSFELVRMPLFTFISGLVYAYRPAVADRLGAFFGKKLRRLLIPFVTISTLFFMAQSLAPGANGSDAPEAMWRIYLFSYAHFWYLQALFLIFLVVGLLDAFRIISRPIPFAILLALALAGGMTLAVPGNPFSVNEAMILLPHFLLGVAVTRFPALFRRPEIAGLAVAGLVLAVAIHQTALFRHDTIGWHSPVAFLCGMCGALVLLRVMPSSALFRRIGGSSYSIYLHHAFFTAGTRIVLHRLGADDLTLFLVSLAAGIAGPLVLEALASLRPLTRVALVGKT
ncbi:acyltransferase family protein [Azospirillum soli]|uniref:acyltransferase family protein n=1 Tax=Azospirillum soli TaxID=1304799 RepID=UPI001AE79D9C|nr:acyltransferase [Azospirillum soli]MBP2312180.1 fucose 4-O-acetylase-like acetyltransferase [Azospirillum soli]